MPRYIDADLLWDKISRAYQFEDKRGALGYIKQCLNEAPTADVEPVRLGKWYEYGERNYKRCSICHERYSPPLGVFPPFCLNCGAKMDKEE